MPHAHPLAHPPHPSLPAARNEFDQTIQETEAAYMKILESSQTLLNVLKRESINLTKKRAGEHGVAAARKRRRVAAAGGWGDAAGEPGRPPLPSWSETHPIHPCADPTTPAAAV